MARNWCGCSSMTGTFAHKILQTCCGSARNGDCKILCANVPVMLEHPHQFLAMALIYCRSSDDIASLQYAPTCCDRCNAVSLRLRRDGLHHFRKMLAFARCLVRGLCLGPKPDGC